MASRPVQVNSGRFYGCSIDVNIEAPTGFVPMIWGWSGPGHQFPTLPSSATTVLGFNEPNHRDQANIDPVTAAWVWMELQVNK